MFWSVTLQGVMYQMDRRTSELVGYCSGKQNKFRRPFSGLVGSAFSKGQMVNIQDVRRNSSFDVNVDQPPCTKVKSMALVPVLSQLGAPMGLIQAANKTTRNMERAAARGAGEEAFSSHDMKILSSLASQVRSCALGNHEIRHPKHIRLWCIFHYIIL